MPMATEAECVKSRLGSFAKIGAPAAMALDAQGRSRAVGVVVVAGEAVDRAVLVVREIERQPARAAKRRLAERSVDRRGQNSGQRSGADRYSAHNESGMPPEHEDRARWRLR